MTGKWNTRYCPANIWYYSERYSKWVHVPYDYPSDGATGAADVDSKGWWVHDMLCDSGTWLDRTPCTNWQASTVLSDIMKQEASDYWQEKNKWKAVKRYTRSLCWWPATWLFGGGKARDNGMF